MRTLLSIVVILLAVSLSGCSESPKPAITATLAGPDTIRLDWRPASGGALGQVVQYRNQPTAQFVTLAFLPPTATTYTHDRLIPQTPFYYQVRPFFGHETPAVPATASTGTVADPNWAAPTDTPRPATELRSLRKSDAGGPTGLQAKPTGTNGVLLTWTDHASDADGYLVEVGPAGSSATRVAALLRPGIDQVGIFPQPGEQSATYRVIGFYYGLPTPTASQTTR
jgi:hypothetical protein